MLWKRTPRPATTTGRDTSEWRVQLFVNDRFGENSYEPLKVIGAVKAQREAAELLASYPVGTARVECVPWEGASADAVRFGITQVAQQTGVHPTLIEQQLREFTR